MSDFKINYGKTITLAEYRALDAAGKIDRPLTDRPKEAAHPNVVFSRPPEREPRRDRRRAK